MLTAKSAKSLTKTAEEIQIEFLDSILKEIQTEIELSAKIGLTYCVTKRIFHMVDEALLLDNVIALLRAAGYEVMSVVKSEVPHSNLWVSWSHI